MEQVVDGRQAVQFTLGKQVEEFVSEWKSRRGEIVIEIDARGVGDLIADYFARHGLKTRRLCSTRDCRSFMHPFHVVQGSNRGVSEERKIPTQFVRQKSPFRLSTKPGVRYDNRFVDATTIEWSVFCRARFWIIEQLVARFHRRGTLARHPWLIRTRPNFTETTEGLRWDTNATN